jgi:hypothetical protein
MIFWLLQNYAVLTFNQNISQILWKVLTCKIMVQTSISIVSQSPGPFFHCWRLLGHQQCSTYNTLIGHMKKEMLIPIITFDVLTQMYSVASNDLRCHFWIQGKGCSRLKSALSTSWRTCMVPLQLITWLPRIKCIQPQFPTRSFWSKKVSKKQHHHYRNFSMCSQQKLRLMIFKSWTRSFEPQRFIC